MNKFIKSILNLFKRKFVIPKNPGALPLTEDNRDFQYSAIFGETKYPRVFRRELPNLDIPFQGIVPSCVSCCFSFINQYKSYQEDKKNLNLSFRKVHAETGAYGRGRYVRDVAKYLQGAGQPEDRYCADDVKLSERSFMSVPLSVEGVENALKRKIGAYAFVDRKVSSLCQAVIKSPLAITLGGNNKSWSRKNKIIRKKGNNDWYHCVALWDYNLDEGWFGIVNWWGDEYRRLDINYSLNSAISFEDLPDNNNMLNIIGDKIHKDQYILGKDGLIHLLYNANTLNVGHRAGMWDKEKVNWIDDINKYKRGEDIIFLDFE